MKLFLIPLLFFCRLSGQNQINKELTEFIARHVNYVSFTEREKLFPDVNNSFESVKKFLAGKKENIEEYYLGNYMVVRTTSQGGEIGFEPILSFPIYHIDTFRALLKYKKKDPENYNKLNNYSNTPFQTIGNASGKDGVVEVNLTTGSVKLTVWK